ncbi:MAG: hypothetical protein ACRCYU_03280, partial [Nocardioides sp.]
RWPGHDSWGLAGFAGVDLIRADLPPTNWLNEGADQQRRDAAGAPADDDRSPGGRPADSAGPRLGRSGGESVRESRPPRLVRRDEILAIDDRLRRLSDAKLEKLLGYANHGLNVAATAKGLHFAVPTIMLNLTQIAALVERDRHQLRELLAHELNVSVEGDPAWESEAKLAAYRIIAAADRVASAALGERVLETLAAWVIAEYQLAEAAVDLFGPDETSADAVADARRWTLKNLTAAARALGWTGKDALTELADYLRPVMSQASAAPEQFGPTPETLTYQLPPQATPGTGPADGDDLRDAGSGRAESVGEAGGELGAGLPAVALARLLGDLDIAMPRLPSWFDADYLAHLLGQTLGQQGVSATDVVARLADRAQRVAVSGIVVSLDSTYQTADAWVVRRGPERSVVFVDPSTGAESDSAVWLAAQPVGLTVDPAYTDSSNQSAQAPTGSYHFVDATHLAVLGLAELLPPKTQVGRVTFASAVRAGWSLEVRVTSRSFAPLQEEQSLFLLSSDVIGLSDGLNLHHDTAPPGGEKSLIGTPVYAEGTQRVRKMDGYTPEQLASLDDVLGTVRTYFGGNQRLTLTSEVLSAWGEHCNERLGLLARIQQRWGLRLDYSGDLT